MSVIDRSSSEPTQPACSAPGRAAGQSAADCASVPRPSRTRSAAGHALAEAGSVGHRQQQMAWLLSPHQSSHTHAAQGASSLPCAPGGLACRVIGTCDTQCRSPLLRPGACPSASPAKRVLQARCRGICAGYPCTGLHHAGPCHVPGGHRCGSACLAGQALPAARRLLSGVLPGAALVGQLGTAPLAGVGVSTMPIIFGSVIFNFLVRALQLLCRRPCSWQG